MFFFGLALSAAVIWLLPWWALPLTAFLIGFMLPYKFHYVWSFSLSAGLAMAALSFVRDGQSHGLISKRMAGLLSLPTPTLLFAVIFILGFVTAALWMQAGLVLSKRSAKTLK